MINQRQHNLEDGRLFLAGRGLNLFASLDVAALPDTLAAALKKAGIDAATYPSLILTGNAGPTFWEALQETARADIDPVDTYSRALSQQFVSSFIGAVRWRFLYPVAPEEPDAAPLPIQQLGRYAGWHHVSPLGLGIHSTYGLWTAFRTVFVVGVKLPQIREQTGDSPCDTCRAKPCVSTCPPGAVRADRSFSVTDCVGYRLAPGSSCRDRCLARLACPVGSTYRYALPQIQYHYLDSLKVIQRAYGA